MHLASRPTGSCTVLAESRSTRGGDILWPGSVPLVDVSAEQQDVAEQDIPSPWLMALPILAMIVMMPVALYITGDGDIISGSGSVSVLIG